MGLFDNKKAGMGAMGGGLYNGYKSKIEPEITSTSGKVNRNLREDVAVTALTHGCGTTYLATAIANYFIDIRRGKVTALMDANDTYVNELLNSSIAREYHPGNMSELYSTCQCLVQDCGVYKKMDETKAVSLSLASTKIMMCHADDDYLRELAAFTKERTDADQFFYLFNVLPHEWERKVYAVMDDYEAYCLPLFSAKNQEKETVTIFKKIFKG